MERLYIYTMKRIVSFAAFLLFAVMANAQKPLLALNENNRYVYYQVVDLPGISADSLKKNSAGFVKIQYPKNSAKKITDTGIYVKDKFLTYTNIILKREDGEMVYTLNIECKKAKYRYWITDFVFTPYEKDRYGQLVPKPGIAIPLEITKDKFTKKELDEYMNQTTAFCKQLTDKLKLYMATGHELKKIEHQPAKVVTDKW
jgi:hypothetical protein